VMFPPASGYVCWFFGNTNSTQ